jgi:hypothetical protein
MEDEKKVYTILSKASTCEKIIKGVEMHWNMSGKTELAKITKNPTIVREVLPTAPAGNVYKYGGKFHIIVINSGAVDDIGSLPLLFDTGSPIEGIEKDYFVGDKGKPNLMPQNTIRAVVPLATEKRPVMSFFQERERNKEDFEQYRKLKKERGETVSNRNGYGLFTIDKPYQLVNCQLFAETNNVFPVLVMIGYRCFGGSNYYNTAHITSCESIFALTPMIRFEDIKSDEIGKFFFNDNKDRLFAICFVKTMNYENKFALRVRRCKKIGEEWIADLELHYLQIKTIDLLNMKFPLWKKMMKEYLIR